MQTYNRLWPNPVQTVLDIARHAALTSTILPLLLTNMHEQAVGKEKSITVHHFMFIILAAMNSTNWSCHESTVSGCLYCCLRSHSRGLCTSGSIDGTQAEVVRLQCKQKQEAGNVLTSARGSTPCLISLSAIGSALSASRLAPGCSVPSVKSLVRGTASS